MNYISLKHILSSSAA